MPKIPTRAVPVLLAAALLCGALTGCGGDPADDAGVASLTDTESAGSGASGAKKPLTEEEILEASKKYAACMREHGVDMPDPVAADGGPGSGGIAVFTRRVPTGAPTRRARWRRWTKRTRRPPEHLADHRAADG